MGRHPHPHVQPARVRPGKASDAPDEEAIEEACCRRFERTYCSEPYYSSGRTWNDYAPAYRYGLRGYGLHGGQRFDEIEDELAHEWEYVRGQSRLTWPEARPAMRAAWRMARQRARQRG